MAVTTRALLERGYFPRELPRCFTTVPFATVVESLSHVPSINTWTRAARFNLARPGGLRRPLSIVNPFSQYHVAQAVVSGWADLTEHLAKTTTGLTIPVLDRSRTRAVVPRTVASHTARERVLRMNRARFVLHSDVSQFYPSVYTHALAWAIEGKSVSKARLRGRGRSRSAESVSDTIDRAIRNGQDGQTKGVPIGPDTSFVAAEAILASVDVILETSVPAFARRGFRYMDDLEFFASSRSEAEDVLLAWESALAEFELTLNPGKTEIVEGPVAFKGLWQPILRDRRIRTKSSQQTANDIDDFFSVAFELAHTFPTENVVSYAINRFQTWAFVKRTWTRFQALLFPAMIAEPSSLRHVAYALRRARLASLSVDRDRLRETLEDLIIYHAKLSHGAEVLWSLWIMCEHGIRLTSRAGAAVADMDDNPCLIVLLYMEARGLIEGPLDTAPVLRRAEGTGALNTSDWLLAYESARHKWCSDRVVRRDRAFAELLDAEVTFFNPRLRTAVPVSRLRSARDGGVVPSDARIADLIAAFAPPDAGTPYA